ncbi:hypothetical protein F5Y18DRAFT_434054 [Xylariaceae sp. FL1019]|nr:hypothetical protein F5Y18DRAFT_434054 [Xylariaceae sp. FL1019]
MAQERPRPELSTVDGFNRKYGRYDFKRFDHLVSQHASLGAASLGRIHVDCKFLFKKSRWGTLEGHDAAGIIYLDLAFSQPSDCRLKNATVQVTLDDEDEHLTQQFPHEGSRQPVQIVKYGPRHMTGEPQCGCFGPSDERTATRNTYIPSVNVGPFGGLGGVGRESSKVTVRECRWMFDSHLMTGSRKGKSNWAYKVLQWNITENELESQSLHSNTVHTAFSFVHGGQPFFMRVEVSGRLESLRSDIGHQIKHKMRQLRFPANPQNTRYATTLINFNGRQRFTTPLDGLVQGLELAMEHDNMTSPTEVRRVQRPRFFEDQASAPVAEQSTHPPAEDDSLQEDHTNQTVPTIDDIASLSSRWLMAPPLTPVTRHPERGQHKPASPRPSERPLDIRSHRSHSRGDGDIVNGDSRHGKSEQRLMAVANAAGPNLAQGQLANQVDISTVVFIMRIWMMQTLATLLGSWVDSTGR